MKKWKLYLLGSIIVLTLGGMAVVAGWSTRPAKNVAKTACQRPDGQPWNFAETTIRVGNQPISVALADTHEEKQKGLGGCEALAENTGMYFVFNPAGAPTFWMKDTLIPLDIIWGADGKVAGIIQNIQPELGVADSALKRYRPEGVISGALELPAGTVERLGIQVGASIAF